MRRSQEETEAAIRSIRSWLEETIKHRAEDVLVCVYQRTQGLCKELNKKIDGTQVHSQAVKTSIGTNNGTNDEVPNTCHAARTGDQDSKS
jgi:undecaprenyl pyrophosphate synthase